MRTRFPLHDLLASPLQSVQGADRMLRGEGIDALLSKGEYDESSVWVARTLRASACTKHLAYPRKVDAPFAALLPHGQLGISRAVVGAAMQPSAVVDDDTLLATLTPDRRRRRPTDRRGLIETRVEVRSGDEPPGIAAIVQSLSRGYEGEQE